MQIPTKTTLKKYGLDEAQWVKIYLNQAGLCACCEKPFWDSEKDEKLRNSYVDHQHVPNYKKLPPENKRQFIRGILCFQCNRLLNQKSNTVEKLKKAVVYLERYETRVGKSQANEKLLKPQK